MAINQVGLSYSINLALLLLKTKISKVQKMICLKPCLTGPAERLLKSLETTEAIYNNAVKILTDRYHNKRIIVRNSSLWLELLNFDLYEHRGHDISFQLLILHNIFHEAALALQSMNQLVVNIMWDCIGWYNRKWILNDRKHGNNQSLERSVWKTQTWWKSRTWGPAPWRRVNQKRNKRRWKKPSNFSQPKQRGIHHSNVPFQLAKLVMLFWHAPHFKHKHL